MHQKVTVNLAIAASVLPMVVMALVDDEFRTVAGGMIGLNWAAKNEFDSSGMGMSPSGGIHHLGMIGNWIV